MPKAPRECDITHSVRFQRLHRKILELIPANICLHFPAPPVINFCLKMVRFGAILQDKYRILEGFTVQRLLMVGCGTKGAKIGTSCLKCDGWKSYQLGTINKDEVPETFPATKTGLTGTGTPTAAGITSVGTCSNGTDVIGASTVQNCAAEFGKDVDPAAAMVSGAD